MSPCMISSFQGRKVPKYAKMKHEKNNIWDGKKELGNKTGNETLGGISRHVRSLDSKRYATFEYLSPSPATNSVRRSYLWHVSSAIDISGTLGLLFSCFFSHLHPEET